MDHIKHLPVAVSRALEPYFTTKEMLIIDEYWPKYSRLTRYEAQNSIMRNLVREARAVLACALGSGEATL